MSEFINANERFIGVDLRSQFINKTDRWRELWAYEDEIQCPLNDGELKYCHWVKQDALQEDDNLKFTELLDNGMQVCKKRCGFGIWYLIQAQVNSGLYRAWEVEFKVTDKILYVKKFIHDMHADKFPLLFVCFKDVALEKAEDFVNKMLWQVLKKARLFNAYISDRQVIYIDTIDGRQFITTFDKMNIREAGYYNEIEWLFISVTKECMADKYLDLINLVNIRCRLNKKTVLINYKNADDFTLLYGRKRVESAVIEDADIVYKEGK